MRLHAPLAALPGAERAAGHLGDALAAALSRRDGSWLAGKWVNAVPLPAVIVSILAYIGLGSLALHLLGGAVSRSWRPAAAGCFALLFFAGWIWLVAGMVLGSARSGLLMLRWWVALVGGLLVAVGPFALLPHPFTIVVGAILGVAFGSWVATGKARWLHRES